jgi:rubrerythrin
MTESLSLKEVLDLAIAKEMESQKMYAELGCKSRSKAVAEAFQMLIAQEKEHQELLERYRAGELGENALHMEHPCDYHIAEHFAEPKPSADMELKDVFLLAADLEKASYDFYMELACLHPRGELRTLLEKLASQELEHKALVEEMFTEVAFPQTQGG